jgi:large repetitive protein
VLANTATSTTLGANCASGSTDTRCSATVTVPGLTIVKTADTATTTPGSVVRFTIVVTNTGQTAYPAATLTDGLAGVLDDATYRADASTTSGNLSFTSPALTWTGALAVGATATITYSVVVADPDNGNRSLSGTVVSASAGSPCPSDNPAAQCTATVTVLVPALSITNSADVSTTTPGGTVAYTVTLSNTGQTPYSASTVTVALAGALDDATYDGDVSATAGAVSVSGAVLTWTGNLAVGAVVTITASVTVRSPDPGDRALTTTATSTVPGSTCPTGSANTACGTSVAVLVPGLTIATAADVDTAAPGAKVTYTVSITNSGQTPYTGATTSSTLSGLLDDASYDSDASATTGAVSVSGAVLTWTGNLAVGATATVRYSVTVDDPDPGDRTLRTTVSSTTPGNNCPAASADTRCVSAVAVLVPAVTFTTVADTETATPNQVVRYTVTVTNTGETAYRGLSVTLDLAGALDDAVYDYNATITAGDLVTNPDGTAYWVLDLAPGASAVGELSLTVSSPATGDRSLRVITVADMAGSACRTGSADPGCRSTVTVLIPGLTVTKTADTSTVSPGGTVGYTIAVVNSGGSDYSDAEFTDNLEGVLVDATYGDDATATTGTVSYGAPVLTWHGALAPGGTATITYSVTVRDPDPGDKHFVNTVVSTSAGNNCLAGGTDPRCTAAVDVLVPGLTIVVTSDVPTTTPGSVVTFTVAATNSGATDFGGAAFTNSLAGVLDDAAYNADAAASTGTVGYSAGVLTWTGALATGATATITYSVTVHSLDDGNDLATTTATSTTAGTNCVTGDSDTRCTATVAVGRLILSQWATETTTTPGSVVHLTATYENTGEMPYTGISVASPRGDTADDTVPTGDQQASSGTVVRTTDAVTWTGDIPVGATITITRTLIVQNPDPGNKLITATLSSAAPGNNCPTATTDPRCTFLVTVLVPGLTVTKTADTTATVPGGTVTYTITAHNTGQTPYLAATFTDPLTGLLDDAGYNDDATTTAGTVTADSSGLSWTGDLATGATAVITYSVTAHSPATGDKTMVNVVTSTVVGSTCPPGSGNAACRRTVVVLTAALTIVKTASLANATLGTTVTYTIAVQNSGQVSQPATFTDTLTGVLDDATYHSDATASSGTVGYAAGVLTWTGGLAPGGTATVTYTVAINNPATGDLTMPNTVTSTTTGNNCASGSDDTRCTATVVITEAVSATFTKTADRAAAVAGDVVTYTVTVTNSSVSSLDAAFTDPLTDILDDATYDGDATPSGGTVGYEAPNLTWSGTVAASATVTVTYSVTVGTAVTGDQILVGTVTSTTPTESNNCLADSGDPRCTDTVLIAALSLEQHYTETSTTPGSLVHLNATFTNTGQLPYTGITVWSPSTDTIDDAIPSGDQAASSGTLTLGATAISWTGDIPAGGAVTVTGTLTVKNTELGNKILTGTLVSEALGNDCPSADPAPQCVAYLPVLVPGLSIAKTADTTSVAPGGTVAYTVAIHNTGEAPYVGATVSDNLVGVLDDATAPADVNASAGAVTFTSPVLTWTGDLAPGATATVTYSATARDPATGDKTMVNPVTSTEVGNTCPAGSDDPACRSIVDVLTPALTISSAASVATTVPGATVGFTLTVTNAGQTAYPAAALTVPLDEVLDDATYGADASASTGTVALAGETLTWTGSLALGATATITYSVTVDQPVTGDFLLSQTVVSASQGSNCPAGDADPPCTTSVAVAGLRIVNSVDAVTTQPTAVVRNTVTVTNTGQVPYLGLVVTDSFVGSLDDATYNGDATAAFGSLQLVTGTGRIVWTGDLPVGETLVVTGTLTVNNPDLGDKILTTLTTTTAAASNCPVASPGAECASSASVSTPGLTVTKAADTVVTTPGATVAYTVTVTNSGQTAYAGATVHDSLDGVLPDAAYDGDATATTGTVTYAEPTLTWTGDLAVGQTVVISYTVRVQDLTLGDKLMVNVVLSDQIGSNCPTGEPAPACSTLVSILVPALDIAVTSDRTTAVPGTTVGYTLTIRNTGQTDYPSATVSVLLVDVLDDATYGGDATANTGDVTFADSTLTWTGDLTTGADTATIAYTVTVGDPPTGDWRLATTVTSPAPGSTCGTAPQCANTVTVLVPGLAVTTSADVATTTPGDRVVLTITASNTGQTPYTGTTITTALTDVLDDAEFDGTSTASSGVLVYTEPDLSWTGTLAVGATVTITYAVTIRAPDPGDRVLSTTVVAPAQGSSCPVATANPACTASVTVLVPSLAISISSSSATTVPGAVVTYTVTLDNEGQTPYSGAVVDDSLSGVLPDAGYNDDAVASSGVLAYAEPTLTWTGDLAIGAGATITYSVTVDDPDPGDKLLVNTVSATAPGSTCPPGATLPTCSAQVRVLVPALVITKSADRSSVVAGDAVGYTVVLTNTGQTPYTPATFTDSLTDVLDGATYSDDAAASVGTVGYLDGVIVWNGALTVGATATITYSVATLAAATGDRLLLNTVSSTTQGANCRADSPCGVEVAVLVPALTITKTADLSTVVAGGALRYTVSATNTGEADYAAATLSDSLADVLLEATYNNDVTVTTGSVGYSSGTLTWIGALPRDASVVLTFSVTVTTGATDGAVLTNRVVSTSSGSTCAADSVTTGCTASVLIAARTIALTDLASSFMLTGLPNSTVGSNGTVTMTVTTNSTGGYVVSVQAATVSLTGASPGNNATIPIGLLRVRETGTQAFRPLSTAVPLVVHQQDTPSAPGGDAVSNDYRIQIPFIQSDTYSTTLDYIVSTQ